MLTKDLSITFCDVKFPNPLYLSSLPVDNCYEICTEAYDTSWGGVVFKTVGFSIANGVSPRFDRPVKKDTGFISFRNMGQVTEHPSEENLAVLRRLREDYPDKVLIASVMGGNEQQWGELTRLMQEAGADMIECNFSCPQMTSYATGSGVGQNPELIEKYCRAVRRGPTLSVLAKMTPNIGNIYEVALAARRDDADGIVAINTVKFITNIDLDQKISMPIVNGKSSVSGCPGKAVKPIALRFTQQMRTHPELCDLPIGDIGGIETWENTAEFLLLGAATLQVTTGIMQYGYRIVEDMTNELSYYLADQGFDSLQEMVGLTSHNIVPTEDLDRSHIVYPHINLDRYVGCGRCYISYYGGDHQATKWSKKARISHCNTEKYMSCLLCGHVYPVGCIDLEGVEFKKGEREHPVTLQSPSHFRYLVPVAGCGSNALSGLQNRINQYVVLIVDRIERTSIASGI